LLAGRGRGRGERREVGLDAGGGNEIGIGLGEEAGEGIAMGRMGGVRTKESVGGEGGVDGLLGRRTSLAKRLLKRREWACG